MTASDDDGAIILDDELPTPEEDGTAIPEDEVTAEDEATIRKRRGQHPPKRMRGRPSMRESQCPRMKQSPK